MMSKRRFILILFSALVLFTLLGFGFIHSRVHRYDKLILTQRQLDLTGWPRPRVAIVFGASVYSNGTLSPLLEDRMKTAVELYQSNQVDRILVSGDNRSSSYNEPKAMSDYLLSHAVAPRDIVIDYAGRSTYETCLRAKEVFQLERAVLVTQQFHLPRALYLSHQFKIDAVGVAADQRPYGAGLLFDRAREALATVKAFLNVNLFSPPVILGEKIQIR